MNKTREELIAMSDEEIMCWVYDVPIGSTYFSVPNDPVELESFKQRWDARFGVSLTRAGIICSSPSISGELKLEV